LEEEGVRRVRVNPDLRPRDQPGARLDVRDLADVGAAADQVLARGFDVLDDQEQPLQGLRQSVTYNVVTSNLAGAGATSDRSISVLLFVSVVLTMTSVGRFGLYRERRR
jgi:hypothetical protein